MIFRLSLSVRALLVGMILWLLPHSVTAAEVRLTDGSTRVGTPDRSTDESALCLRCGDSNAYIVYGIAWQKISEIRQDSETWLPDRFDEFRQHLKSRANGTQPERPAHATVGDQSVIISLPVAADDLDQQGPELESSATRVQPRSNGLASSSRPLWEPPATAGPSEPTGSRVRFIDVDAVAANWNDSVEWDGIVMRVWPMDQWGDVVKAHGTLEVTLFGEGAGEQRIGHWVRFVRPSNYGHDGASVRLEYQNYHPERWDAVGHADHRIARHGELHVKMAIAGHGVFHSSTNLPVPLRRYSPMRDRQFLRTGTRFFIPYE